MAEKRRGRKPTGSKLERQIAAVLGPRLKSAREGVELTQQQLAERVQVVRAYVSMCEQGARLASVGVLAAWARECAVPIGDFFDGLEEEMELRARHP